MQATISEVLRLTLILAGAIVGRWWMLIAGPALSIAVVLSRPRLILPGPEFFAYLALDGVFHVGVGLLLRQAGRAIWRTMVRAWLRFLWPRLGEGARSFLTVLRVPLRASIIANVAWPLLFFTVYFFWYSPRRGDAAPVPTLPLQVVTYAIVGAIGAWAGYRLTNRGTGGIGRAILGALTIVLVTEAAVDLLALPITTLMYLVASRPDDPSQIPQLLKQLASQSTVSSACGAIGGWVGRTRTG